MSCVHPSEHNVHAGMLSSLKVPQCKNGGTLGLMLAHNNAGNPTRGSNRDPFLDDELTQGSEGPEQIDDCDVDETLPLPFLTLEGCAMDPANTHAPPTPIVGCSVQESDDVRKMRAWLEAEGWSESRDFFSDDFLIKSMSALKDGKPRTFEYAAKKLASSLQWRREYGAASITRQDVARALGPNHMWWDGSDIHGRPILYVRPALMDLKTYDRAEYLKAHVYLIEQGLKLMPKVVILQGVETFVLITDASSLGRRHFDPALMKGLLKVLSVGYPDRLGNIVVGPTNLVVRAAWALLSHLMPKRIAEKILIVKSPKVVAEHLLGRQPPGWLP